MPTPNAGITVNALQEVITLNIKPAKNTPTNNPLKLLGHFKIHQYAILLNKPHSSKMFVRIYAPKTIIGAAAVHPLKATSILAQSKITYRHGNNIAGNTKSKRLNATIQTIPNVIAI